MVHERAAATDEPGLVDVVGPVWSEAKVCDAAGVNRDGLAARRRAGSVLALTTSDGDWVYPVFQFRRRDGLVEVEPGIVPLVVTLLGFDQWAVAVLLRTPAPELEGRTPMGWLRAGGAAEVVADLATQVRFEWSAGSNRST